MADDTVRPRVSVVMTAYNQVQFLPAAIDSVLAQELDGYEVVLVDDGSHEDIAATVAPYRDRVRYVRRDNGGLAAARNTGWQAARGRYVAFCDADDIHLPYRLAAHAALLDQCPEAAQVYSDLAVYQDGQVTSQTTLRGRRGLGPVDKSFDDALEHAYGRWDTAGERDLPVPDEFRDRRVYQGRIPQLIATYHVAWGGASMYRRDALLAVGGHDERLRRWPDWYLASLLSKSYELVYLDLPVLWYRQHEGQLTRQAAVGARAYRDIVYEVWKSDAAFAARHPDILARIVKQAAMRQAYYDTQAGDLASARRHIVDSIRHNPLDWRGYSALARTLLRQTASWFKRG